MRENYISIQYLRALAAIMVVIYHARNPQPWLYNPLEGFHGLARGVDIFFVISGFIMAAIGSKETPIVFAKKRIIRVAPIYWLTSIIAAAILLRKSELDHQFVMHVAMSLTFVPHLNPNNEAFPVLPPGWTLNYEMYFYALFFACLWTKRPIRNCTLALILLVVVGSFVDRQNPIVSTYTNPHLLEFAAGLIVGRFRQKISSKQALALLAPVGFIFLLMAGDWLSTMTGAILTVIGTLAWERKFNINSTWKDLGDASYFTYLSHHFVLAVLLKVWPKLPLEGWTQFLSFVTTCTALSCLVGIIGHKVIEKPLTKKLNDRFNSSRKASSAGLQKL